MEEEKESNDFRFLSKKEYEKELSRLIAFKNSLSMKSNRDRVLRDSLEEDYDSLMEEYLIFCSVDRDV